MVCGSKDKEQIKGGHKLDKTTSVRVQMWEYDDGSNAG